MVVGRGGAVLPWIFIRDTVEGGLMVLISVLVFPLHPLLEIFLLTTLFSAIL